jgi:hypothetical protein
MKVTLVAKYQLKEYLPSSLPVGHLAPQHYVFASLLFILYVIYVPHLTQGRAIKYADDTWY